MAKKRIITSKYFRLWDITDEKKYIHTVVLDKISFRFTMIYGAEPAKRTIFYLRERLFTIGKSYLLNLKPAMQFSIARGKCENPNIYVESQVISTFNINHINQIDIDSIMAMAQSDIEVIEVLAQIEVDITEENIKSILKNMDIEDG